MPPKVLAALIVAVAALGAAFAFPAPLQAQDETYVDLSIEVKVVNTDWVFIARNHGTADAYGVTVDVEIADQSINRDNQIKLNSGTDCSGNIPGTTCARGVWTVGFLGVGQEKEAAINTRLASGLPCCPNASDRWTAPARAVIKNTVPEEEERFESNNTDVGWILLNLAVSAAADYWLEASVDDLLPDAGDTVKFNFKVDSPGGSAGSVYGAKVRLKLDYGLGTPTAAAPSGTTFGAATDLTRTWDWDFDLVHPTSSRTLEVSTTLDNPLPSGVARSDLCLTADLTARSDTPSTGRATSAEICLGEDPVTLFQTGEVDLLDLYPCVGVTTYPCSSTDTLELVVNGKEAPPAVGFPRRVGGEAIMDPGNVIIRVKDPDGRDQVSGVTVWRSGSVTTTGNAPAGQLPGVVANLSLPSPGYTAYTFGISDAGTKPGSFTMINAGNTGFVLLDVDTKQSLGPINTTATSIPLLFQFGKLGTFEMALTLGGTDANDHTKTYTDTETYTFHVGPVAELEVRDAGPSSEVPNDQRDFTILAVNNGPDDAPAAQVTVTGLSEVDYVSHSASHGTFAPPTGESTTGIWTIGELRGDSGYYRATGHALGGPALTIITSAGANSEITAEIENTQEYQVCIDSSGDDVDAASESACTGTWHTANYYDHISDNDSATIAGHEGTGTGKASTTAVVGVVLDWEPADDVNGFPVTRYEIHRQEEPGQDDSWELLATVPASPTRYVDTDVTERDEPYVYRVRALNRFGVAGLWLITIEGLVGARVEAQSSEVSLKLTPMTIGEVDNNEAKITATLARASGQDIEVTVSAAPAARSDTVPEDFTLSPNNILTIPAGSLESRGNVVTVTAEDDGDSDDERITITAEAINARGSISALTLTIDDDDDPGLTLNTTTVEVDEDDTAGGTYTVELDAQPSGDVTVTPSSNNIDVTVAPASLTFTADNWDTAQTFTVRADADNDAADDIATITHTVSGASEYRGIRAQAVSVTVDDVDTPRVTVEADADLTVMEDGRTSVQYVVKLETEPSDSVYITATGSDNDAATVSPASFTLTRRNWEQGQTVTVRARADQDADYETLRITHAIDAARTSADEYDGLGIAGVMVSVIDAQAPADYDADNDKLLDIATQAQLNAIRWDLDGNGVADDKANEAAYARAFPRMMANSCGAAFDPGVSKEGAPGDCKGYELMNDITLSGNWAPIGGNLHFDDYDSPLEEYRATFDGDYHVISKLSINGSDRKFVGLFGAIRGSKAKILNVGVENVNVRGRNLVGALVGRNHGGTIERAWSTGLVSGNTFAGGLVGWSLNGLIQQSYSEANVAGWNAPDSGGPIWSTRIGGLVGGNHGTIADSYAWGDVRGRGHVAGLAGENGGGATIRNSYATGAVSTEDDFPFKAGLVGWQQNGSQQAVANSYWDTETTGQDSGVAQGNESGAVGKTTKALQDLTGPTGIYAEWDDTRVEGDGTIIDVWNFRKGEYPCLTSVGSCPAITAPQQHETLPNMRASVTVTTAADPVALDEGGTAADAYQVVLDGEPTGDVVIAVSSDNADVSTQPPSLTFTPNNWGTAQSVTVRASHDDDAADDTATIGHTVSGADEYAEIAVASVSVSVADDDTAGITVSESSLEVPEGGSATYTVSLSAAPAIGEVGISVFGHGVTVQPAELRFTPDNWSARTVTVSAGQDDNTANETAAVTHSVYATAGSGYAGVGIPNPHIVVTVIDDDEEAPPPQPQPQPAQQQQVEPGSVTVSASDLSLREGDDAGSYTVALDAEPTADVVIAVSSDNVDVTVEPVELTFTPVNWQAAQTVSVAAVEDEDESDDTAIISHAVSGAEEYAEIAVDSVSVSVTDDDSDVEVLRDFYDATDGDNWATSTNWLSEQPLSEWYGVTVDGHGRVTDLSLRDNNLVGELPAELGKLESLEVLSLDRNSLSGVLPVELGSLSNLTRLALNRNQITGAIPSELGDIASLSIIGLARNSLSGSLPDSLGNLTGLTRLSLHDNTGLSGALPSGFLNMGSLQRLAVANTGLCAPNTEAFTNWLGTVGDLTPADFPRCE